MIRNMFGRKSRAARRESEQGCSQDDECADSEVSACDTVEVQPPELCQVAWLVSTYSKILPLPLQEAQLHPDAHDDGGLACSNAELLEVQRK